MKYIKLFEDFDQRSAQVEKSETPKTSSVVFASPLTVMQDFTPIIHHLQEMDPSELTEHLSGYGIDIASKLNYYNNSIESEEADEETALNEFYNSVEQQLRMASFEHVQLENSQVDLRKVEDAIVSDFNQANLFQYYEGPNKADSIKSVGLSEKGEFLVEVKFENVPTSEDIELMKEFLAGQYSDGWGEGFEQTPIEGGSDEPDYIILAWTTEYPWSIREIY